MYALSLHWQVDLATFDLSEKAAEAAFALAGVFSDQEPGDRTMHEEAEDQEESDAEGFVFPWEDQPTELPQELAVLWRRYTGAGAGRFDTKGMLDQMPRFGTLPLKAPDNNVLGRADGMGPAAKLDRALKAQQQFLLHSLWTPGAARDTGGSIREDGAQGNGETRLDRQLSMFNSFGLRSGYRC